MAVGAGLFGAAILRITSYNVCYTKLLRIALSVPEPYVAVGAWYRHFDQTSDREVVDLLAELKRGGQGGSAPGPSD